MRRHGFHSVFLKFILYFGVSLEPRPAWEFTVKDHPFSTAIA